MLLEGARFPYKRHHVVVEVETVCVDERCQDYAHPFPLVIDGLHTDAAARGGWPVYDVSPQVDIGTQEGDSVQPHQCKCDGKKLVSSREESNKVHQLKE